MRPGHGTEEEKEVVAAVVTAGFSLALNRKNRLESGSTDSRNTDLPLVTVVKSKPRRSRPSRQAASNRTRPARDAVEKPPRFYKRPPFLFTLLSGICLFLSFPPVGWSPLGWCAPLLMVELVRRQETWTRRDYVHVWFAGWLQWLVLLYGVRIAHPWLNVGWIVLAGYVATYNPLFLWLSRVATQRLRLPLTLVCPTIWVGLEYARGFMFTGFSLALLAHSQIYWTSLIQVADLFGAYAVSYLMMTVATVAVVTWHQRTRLRQAFVPLSVAVVLLAATLGYGFFRLGQSPPDRQRQLTVALLQGSMDVIFEFNPERDLETFKQYRDLSYKVAASGEPLDLIVWPESVFILPEVRIDEDDPPDWDADERKLAMDTLDRFEDVRRQLVQRIAELHRSATRSTAVPHCIIGTQTRVYAGKREVYNAALVVDPQGEIQQRYNKMHPVWFGETIPLGDVFPFLYDLSPMEMGMSVGDGALNFKIGDFRLCPNICFEITVPHLIRRQFLEAASKDQRPDAFVNLTNDGWFWGSSILDFQFAGAVFRAVENRCPVLVAANCGITAHIDGNGQVVEKLPRRIIEPIVTRLKADGRRPPHHLWGDWAAAICVVFCCLAVVAGLRKQG